MKWFIKALQHYADFSGRARRKEFWMFSLFNILFILGAIMVDNILGWTAKGLPYGVVYCLYSIAVLIPGLAVSVRRLHDTGKSGWMLLVALIPLVGWIWLLALLLKKGQLEENKYGSNSKTSDNLSFVNYRKSMANAFILSSGLSIIAIVFSELEMKLGGIYEEWFLSGMGIIDFIMFKLYWLIPLGMLIFGIFSLPKFGEKKYAPVTLIITSVIGAFLQFKIIAQIMRVDELQSFSQLVGIPTILIFIALLAIGIFMIQGKRSYTVTSLILIIGCLFNIVYTAKWAIFSLSAISYLSDKMNDFTLLYLKELGFSSTITLIVFAFFLISKHNNRITE